MKSAWGIMPMPSQGAPEAISKNYNPVLFLLRREGPLTRPFLFLARPEPPEIILRHPFYKDRVAGRSASCCAWNCAASVDPANAVVEE
jgi:hypothetical protein